MGYTDHETGATWPSNEATGKVRNLELKPTIAMTAGYVARITGGTEDEAMAIFGDRALVARLVKAAAQGAVDGVEAELRQMTKHRDANL